MPPPVPRGSDQRQAPRFPLQLNNNLLRPSSRLGHVDPARYTSSESSGSNNSLATSDLTPEYIEDMRNENPAIGNQKPVLKNQIRQVDDEMDRVKALLRKSTGQEPTHQEALQEWLRLRRANTRSRLLKNTRKDSVVDTQDFGPIGGKLIYNEKIPTGPDSTFAEDIKVPKSPLVYDERYKILELRDKKVLKRPRHEYYATRVLERPVGRSKGPTSPNTAQESEIRPEKEEPSELY